MTPPNGLDALDRDTFSKLLGVACAKQIFQISTRHPSLLLLRHTHIGLSITTRRDHVVSSCEILPKQPPKNQSGSVTCLLHVCPSRREGQGFLGSRSQCGNLNAPQMVREGGGGGEEEIGSIRGSMRVMLPESRLTSSGAPLENEGAGPLIIP